MKCKKCGVEIPNNNLYCEKCGEEVHIVPFFEPEVETTLDESMHQISDELADKSNYLSKKTGKKKKHYLLWVLILVILSLAVGLGALIYLFNSPMYQINRGNRYAYDGDYKKALDCYLKALERNPEEPVEIYRSMVECCDILGYEGKYEEYLLRIINTEQVSYIDEYYAYNRLISLYEEGKSYQTINNLLKSCNNDSIVGMYKDYLVSEPKFSHLSGEYSEIIPLKITSPQGYTVYYTLDGSDPTIESNVFKTPIFLEDGAYEFRAICVDEHGVVSDMVTMKYQVDFASK